MQRQRRVRLSGDRYNPLFPAGSVIITHGEYWGNPHRVGSCEVCDGRRHDRAEAALEFYRDLETGRLPYTVEDVRRELSGKVLACWCRPMDLCHGDILLQVIDGATSTAA